MRTAVGPFRLEEAHSLAELERAGVETVILPPEAALPGTPAVTLDSSQLEDLRQGRPTSLPTPLNAERVRVYDPSGARMVFVGAAEGHTLRARIPLYMEPSPA